MIHPRVQALADALKAVTKYRAEREDIDRYLAEAPINQQDAIDGLLTVAYDQSVIRRSGRSVKEINEWYKGRRTK